MSPVTNFSRYHLKIQPFDVFEAFQVAPVQAHWEVLPQDRILGNLILILNNCDNDREKIDHSIQVKFTRSTSSLRSHLLPTFADLGSFSKVPPPKVLKNLIGEEDKMPTERAWAAWLSKSRGVLGKGTKGG